MPLFQPLFFGGGRRVPRIKWSTGKEVAPAARVVGRKLLRYSDFCDTRESPPRKMGGGGGGGLPLRSHFFLLCHSAFHVPQPCSGGFLDIDKFIGFYMNGSTFIYNTWANCFSLPGNCSLSQIGRIACIKLANGSRVRFC